MTVTLLAWPRRLRERHRARLRRRWDDEALATVIGAYTACRCGHVLFDYWSLYDERDKMYRACPQHGAPLVVVARPNGTGR